MATNTNHSSNGDYQQINCCEPMEVIEEILATDRSNSADTQFDTVIGHIEDIFMDPEFQTIQIDFLDENYHHFSLDDENKFIYTDIHRKYTQLVETYLMDELKRRMVDFDVAQFFAEITSRGAELEGEIFEILLTFTDFLSFKEMMLDYKKSRDGLAIDLSGGITVTHIPIPAETFDMGLTVSGISTPVAK